MQKQRACHHCDQLVNIPSLEYGQNAYCPNCNTLLSRSIKYRNQKILRLALVRLFYC